MPAIQGLISIIDRFTDVTGKALAWLGMAMALLTALIVTLRYGFSIGSIAMQEMTVYMHSALFLLGAAYALKSGAHVRVDIFYRRFSPRGRAWVNSLGTVIFLFPLGIFTAFVCWEFVANSWAIGEVSAEPGGLPAVYLLKTLMILMPVNLLLQGTAELLRNGIALVTETGYPE